MGTEGLVADELSYGGFEGVAAQNGSVAFSGGISDLAKANINLRCGERVLIKIGETEARSFEELFEGVKALGWSSFIGKTDAFPVKGHSVRSRLTSIPACQSIIKKAIVESLKAAYKTDLPETGAKKQISFFIMNDRASLFIDTSGAPLYKRGYKLEQSEASIRETLAAAMVKTARYKGREPFYDPMCGSGTLAIEAATAALCMAPGLKRRFEAESWGEEYKNAFRDARAEALSVIKREKLPIFASDADEKAVEMTRENAKRCGVLDCIEVFRADALKTDWRGKTGVLMCDPPYGVRMLDRKKARLLISAFGEKLSQSALKMYILSADENFEEVFGKKADKRRKLYNGMIKCNLYMYFKG